MALGSSAYFPDLVQSQAWTHDVNSLDMMAHSAWSMLCFNMYGRRVSFCMGSFGAPTLKMTVSLSGNIWIYTSMSYHSSSGPPNMPAQDLEHPGPRRFSSSTSGCEASKGSFKQDSGLCIWIQLWLSFNMFTVPYVLFRICWSGKLRLWFCWNHA